MIEASWVSLLIIRLEVVMVFTSWYILNYAFVRLRPSSWFLHHVLIGFQSHSGWKTYFTSRKARTQSSLISHPLPSIPLIARFLPAARRKRATQETLRLSIGAGGGKQRRR
jgi:hypothetical protein